MKKIKIILLVIAIAIANSSYSQFVDLLPSPTQYTVTGGGSYCAGGVGLPVGLTSSETDVIYTCFCNGTAIAQMNGTGSALSFGLQTTGGNYTIEGVNTTTSCSILMTGSATITVNAIPNVQITASGPVEFCGSGSVTLTATPNITTAAYQWYKNGVIISGANNNTYTASQAGMYTVVVTNTITGCSNDASQMVEIHPLPQQFVVSASSSTFCQGSSITINQNSSYSGVNYQLFLNGAITGSPVVGTGNALAWSVNTAGTYTIQATDAITGCQSMMSGSATVTANPLPAAAGTITGPTDICQNSTVTYSTTAITNANSYAWSVPTWTTIVSGQGTSQITLLVNQAGVSGDITVMGQNSCGGGLISTTPIVVNAAPTVNATATPASICAGTSTTLNAGGNATSYSWSNGLGSNSSVSTNPTTTTTYYVTATGSNGCTAIDNIVVTVNQLPTVTLALSPSSACQGVYSVQLTGGSPAGGTYIGGCITGTNMIYPGSLPVNTWPISYQYTDPQTGCSATSASYPFTINPEPWVDFAPFYPGAVIPLDEPPFIVTSGAPYGGDYYGPGFYQVGNNWWFDATLAGLGTHSATYTYTQPSTGCDGQEYRTYVVGPASEENGIDEVTAAVDAVSIFPNPTNSYLNLHGINTQEIVSFVVVDITGRIILEQQNLDENMQLDVNNFVPGTYIIRFTDVDGISVSKRFMKSE